MASNAHPTTHGNIDASSYLQRQGWRGPGYSLDSSDRGITRRVLYSHKPDSSGLGKSSLLVADQWWLRALDTNLRQLGSGNKVRDRDYSRADLYSSFVRGPNLEGTVSQGAANSDVLPVNASSVSPISKDYSSGERPPQLTFSLLSTAGSSASFKPSDPTPSSSTSGSRASVQSFTMADLPNGAATVGAEATEPAPVANGTSAKNQKRKRPKETADQVRKRRKLERIETQKRNIAAKRQKQIEEGTLDLQAEAEKEKLKELNRRLKTFLKRCELQGMFAKEALLEIEAEEKAAKRQGQNPTSDPTTFEGGEGVHADRLQMIGDPSVPQPNYDKNLSYKAEKYMREKRKRVLKREERERLVREMWPDSAPIPEEDLAPAEVKARRAAAKAEKKRVQQEKEAAKKAKAEEKERIKAERREAKRLRREETLKNKPGHAEKLAAIRAEKEAARTGARPENGATVAEVDETGVVMNGVPVATVIENGMSTNGDPGAKVSAEQIVFDREMAAAADQPVTDDSSQDVIKLGSENDKPAEKVRRSGKPAKGPPNKQISTKSTSFPNDMSLDEYKDFLARRGQERAIEKQEYLRKMREKGDSLTPAEQRQLRQEELNIRENELIRRFTIENGLPPALAPPPLVVSVGHAIAPVSASVPPSAPRPARPQEMSEKKKAVYAARAAEKGMSLDEYMQRREEKKARLSGVPPDATTNGHNAGSDADAQASLAFVVDTAGDPSLLDTGGDPSFLDTPAEDRSGLRQPRPTGSKEYAKVILPLNPAIWEGRKVNTLTKVERKARLEWMRARRAVRKQRQGKPTMSPKERRKRRMEMKMEMQNRLAYQVLAKEGVQTKHVSKGELKDARRRAKKMLRQAKKGKEVEGLPEEMRAKVEKKKGKKKRESRGGRNN